MKMLHTRLWKLVFVVKPVKTVLISLKVADWFLGAEALQPHAVESPYIRF